MPPHNVSANVQMLQTFVPDTHIPPMRPFLFTDELPVEGQIAYEVNILQRSEGYRSSFVYNPENNKYYRYVEGSPYVDKYSGEHISFSNVIVQRTRTSYYNGESNRPVTENVGSGNADIFIGGRYIPGYWIRTGTYDRTIFFDQYGNELKLLRGTTFICMFSSKHEVNFR